MPRALLLTLICSLLIACTEKNKEPLTLAINPWPGYEMLYLAQQKNYFSKVGLNLKLVELGSLSDAQRAYLRGNVDGMTSTLIEAIQAQVMGNRPLKIVLLPDYSNGGDVIISRKGISNIQQLKGKTIGCEVSSLGIFMLKRALQLADMTLDDIVVKNVEQADGLRALENKEIDAFISYPPASVTILSQEEYQIIFDSSQIPNEIIDAVSFSEQALAENPDLFSKIHRAWQMALEDYQKDPLAAANIMAAREHISAQDFISILDNEIKVLSTQQQQALFQQPEDILQTIKSVCQTLVLSKSINTDCASFPNILYQRL